MAHPLVNQLRFTRSEFERGLKDVTVEEASRHFEPMNCISWIVGHLAAQEQAYWLTHVQGITPAPEVNVCASGQPACTPNLDDMWAAWHLITEKSNAWLDTLDTEQLQTHTPRLDKPGETHRESIGTRLFRTTYHYWFHLGESQAIRQLLGHKELPGFVGDLGNQAPYTPE
jgi:hypothetical protein